MVFAHSRKCAPLKAIVRKFLAWRENIMKKQEQNKYKMNQPFVDLHNVSFECQVLGKLFEINVFSM